MPDPILPIIPAAVPFQLLNRLPLRRTATSAVIGHMFP